MYYLLHDGLVVIGTWLIPSPFCFAAGDLLLWHTLAYGCLVVIGTWLNAKSLLLFIFILIHCCNDWIFPKVKKAVTSLPCWGRVVIGSLVVYQTSGAGSNPVASTTALANAIRSIGNGQKSCISFAWKGLERSRPFPIFRLIGWLFESFMYLLLVRYWDKWDSKDLPG